MRRTIRLGAAAAGMAAILAAGTTAMSASTATAAGSDRADTSKRVTFLIHGYTYADCTNRWKTLKSFWRSYEWQGPIKSVGYYEKGDSNCDEHIARHATYNTRIQTIAKALANAVYRNYTSKGRSVNLVGHSMGGLIIRTAIWGTQHHRAGYPKSIDVANAVTLSTPHKGWDCTSSNNQCQQMRPGSTFLKTLGGTLPEGKGGTDWTLLGSELDRTVPWNSGVFYQHHADHKFHYLASQPKADDSSLSHGGIREAGKDNWRYNMKYWNNGMKGSRHTKGGWSPLFAAYKATYWAHRW
ncbi:MAG: hypothetical protein WCA46_03970 [Actinocatenispora sp.]